MGGHHHALHVPAATYATTKSGKVGKKLGMGRRPALHHHSLTGHPHFPRFGE
jgi:hypothetical protein